VPNRWFGSLLSFLFNILTHIFHETGGLKRAILRQVTCTTTRTTGGQPGIILEGQLFEDERF